MARNRSPTAPVVLTSASWRVRKWQKELPDIKLNRKVWQIKVLQLLYKIEKVRQTIQQFSLCHIVHRTWDLGVRHRNSCPLLSIHIQNKEFNCLLGTLRVRTCIYFISYLSDSFFSVTKYTNKTLYFVYWLLDFFKIWAVSF